MGTGASLGIPVIGCRCSVCQSSDKRDKRGRSSVYINTGQQKLVIDAGPDFRQQILREKIDRLDAVLMTHEHKDHTAGLDDVRSFNYLQKKPMAIYGEERVLASIKREYAYVFADNPYPGIPEMDLHIINEHPFELNGEEIVPVRAFHNLLPVFGYRMGKFGYLTDAKTITSEEKEKLTHLNVLVINALRIETHVSHMNLDDALDLIEELSPRKAFLTHLSHKLPIHSELSRTLPANVEPGYDGLTIDIETLKIKK